MFHKAVKLEYNEGTVLELTFQDGIVKRYDMGILFAKYPCLSALKDRELFLSGKLTGSYGIIWNDSLDIEAETIYQDGETIRIEEPSPCVAVGSALSKARAEKAISQSALSEATGIDQSDISKIERGIANPSLNTLSRIAKALNCTLNIGFISKD